MRENSYSAGGEKNFGREKECYYLVVAISDDLSDISYYVRYYYYRSRQTAILEERETFISEKKSKRRLWESGILLS